MENKKTKNSAFTLVELLVVIAIFSTLIVAIIGIFVAGVRQQRIALANQTLLDQASFALEFMSRTLRIANKELGQGCLSQLGLNYEITHAGSGIKFINTLEAGDCQEFFVESGRLKYFKLSTGQTLPLTSEKLQVNVLNFNLIGQSQDDNLQPRVTLFLDINGLKLQTTVSQRNLDVRR